MSNKPKDLLLFIVVPLSTLIQTTILVSCSNTSSKEFKDSLLLNTSGVSHYYDLKNPAEKHVFPADLEEVSGLAYAGDNKILCVEDERGRVYEYDLKEKEIVNTINFTDPGDFEGVEVVQNVIYALQSDGSLFAFEYTRKQEADTKEIPTPFGRSNDTEGLGYDPESGNLLIACKESGKIEDGSEVKGKAVYQFDIPKHEFKRSAFFDITSEDLERFVGRNMEDSDAKYKLKFKPSAIATNPVDGYFYLLASDGKVLIVLNKKGEIKASYPIDPEMLIQPEGICFAPNGDLFISSEGDGNKGYMLKYSVKKR